MQFGYDGAYAANLAGLAESIAIPDAVDSAAGFNFYCFENLPPFTHLRFATFDADTTTPGADDIDLRLFRADACDFSGLALLDSSGGVTSDESIDLVNPDAPAYIFVVDHFAGAAADLIDYVAHVYLVGLVPDEGSPVLTAPNAASLGATGGVSVDYSGLTVGSRYLGVVTHEDDTQEIGRTVIDVDAPE